MANLARVENQSLTLNDVSEWQALKEQARIALSSGYLPKSIRTPEQAITIGLAGRELGLPPLTAFRSIHLIDGKITLSADLMHALVHKRVAGAVCNVVVTNNEKCVVEAQRPGGKVVAFEFTLDDAKAAGLTGKENWRKYPAAMLRARAISAACRAVFPEIFLGVYTPEELESAVETTREVERANPVRVEVAEVEELSPPDNWEVAVEVFAAFAEAATSEDELKAKFSELLPKDMAPKGARSRAFKVYQSRVAQLATAGEREPGSDG
jgi:hypothetical protein